MGTLKNCLSTQSLGWAPTFSSLPHRALRWRATVRIKDSLKKIVRVETPEALDRKMGTTDMDHNREIETFIAQWPESSDSCRRVFSRLFDFLSGLKGAEIEFRFRPGISYSLRGVPADVSDVPLFVMIDVIEDQPRWLSVCFYQQMVTDPEGRGDLIPGGLLGEDGLCFDVESEDASVIQYLQQRITEACKAASK